MSEELIIYHNGTCSKCAGALEILQEKNVPHKVRWYLSEPLSSAELSDLLSLLNMKPSELVRRNEPLFQEQYANAPLSEEEWLEVLVANPILLQRPIVVLGNLAIIARPPEKVFSIL